MFDFFLDSNEKSIEINQIIYKNHIFTLSPLEAILQPLIVFNFMNSKCLKKPYKFFLLFLS